jgi:hypothetical protein
MTIRVSSPPQSASSTPATSSAEARPTAKGATVKDGSASCRKGSWTSSECSRAWAAALHRTCASPSARVASASSTSTSPSGVMSRLASGSARPATATWWAGPTSTTRLTGVPGARSWA